MLRRESSDLAPPTAFFTSLKHPCDPPGRETGTQNNRRHDAVPLSMHEERRGNEIEERACLGLFSREWNSDTNDLDSQAFASGRMIAVSNLRRQSSALEPPSSFFSDLSRCLPLDEPDADGLTSLGFEDWGGTGDSRCGTDQDATDTGQGGGGARVATSAPNVWRHWMQEGAKTGLLHHFHYLSPSESRCAQGELDRPTRSPIDIS